MPVRLVVHDLDGIMASFVKEDETKGGFVKLSGRSPKVWYRFSIHPMLEEFPVSKTAKKKAKKFKFGNSK